MAKISVTERALRLLNYRMRSRAELRQALLERGYQAEEVNQVLSQLEEIGLIDDPRFAKSLAETRVLISRRGRHAIFFEMIKKKVSTKT